MDIVLTPPALHNTEAVADALIARQAASASASSSSSSNIPPQQSCQYSGPQMDNFWGFNGGLSSRRLVVVGHRGCGKNNRNMMRKNGNSVHAGIMENTILSFNTAAAQGADFVEFDVQVTKDGCPVIFHDDLIIVADQEKRVTANAISDLSLQEFLSVSYQRGSDPQKIGKALLRRRGADGMFAPWTAARMDSLCTLEEAFGRVSSTIGFNIELKFHDTAFVPHHEIDRVISATLAVVERCCLSRKIYFSSFHPDAVQMLREKQSSYPVFFLTDGGVNLYVDPRRNSLEAAVDVCRRGGLQGIVSEVKAILQHPEAVGIIRQEGLCLLTYGELNNFAEALHKQEEIGVDGVIVDDVADVLKELGSSDDVKINASPKSDIMNSISSHQDEDHYNNSMTISPFNNQSANLLLKPVRAA